MKNADYIKQLQDDLSYAHHIHSRLLHTFSSEICRLTEQLGDLYRSSTITVGTSTDALPHLLKLAIRMNACQMPCDHPGCHLRTAVIGLSEGKDPWPGKHLGRQAPGSVVTEPG